MTRRKEPPKLYGLLSDPEERIQTSVRLDGIIVHRHSSFAPLGYAAHHPSVRCDVCETAPGVVGARHMVVQLRFDRESFDVLKELLRDKSSYLHLRGSDQPGVRRDREALKRVFDQIRDVEYNDGV